MPTMKVMQIQDSWSPDKLRLADARRPRLAPARCCSAWRPRRSTTGTT